MSEVELSLLNAEIVPLVDLARLNDLGPGRPEQSKHAALTGLTPARLVAPAPVRDQDMALACIAGLWLLWDYLDESHDISQSLDTSEGSYWHGIMHRREPDFGNSRYWFRRVGQHPVFPELATQGRQLAVVETAPETAFLRSQEQWDPYRFIDLCQSAAAAGLAVVELCRRVQQAEWQLLFSHCLAGATQD